MKLSNLKINDRGLTLIEVTIFIIITGILAAVAIRSMAPITDSAKVEETKQEMDALAKAISGNESLENNGVRSDFGFVGDVGSMPPNLDALYSNPGSYATWNGPYIQNRFTQIADDFKKDSYGVNYAYNGGVAITSIGSGSNIVRQIAASTGALLQNRLSGNIFDSDGTPPGPVYDDSISIRLTHPNGVGGMISRTGTPDQGGFFSFDSIPIGNHDLSIVYSPADDTLYLLASIIPNSSPHLVQRFTANYWVGSSTSSSSGLVGHWKLDETTADTAHDFSGLGNHGTLLYMDTVNDWVAGKVNGALDFDGSNDFIQIPHNDLLNGSTALTYAAWVYPRSWSGVRNVMAKSVHGGGSGRAQMGIFSEANRLVGRIETTSGRVEVSATLPTLNIWSHVAVVFDSVGLKIYVDGTEANSTTYSARTLIQTTDPLNISKRVGTNQYYFDGRIDDVRVYTRVLSATEVQQLANMGF